MLTLYLFLKIIQISNNLPWVVISRGFSLRKPSRFDAISQKAEPAYLPAQKFSYSEMREDKYYQDMRWLHWNFKM